MTSIPTQEQSPWSTLRRFARPRPPAERCDLCGAALAAVHRHLFEPASRQMRCSCDPCAILFSGQQSARYRRIPRRVQPLPDFKMSDEQWESMHLPNCNDYCKRG